MRIDIPTFLKFNFPLRLNIIQKRLWYQIIQESVEDTYTADDFDEPSVQYHISPQTKEAFIIRIQTIILYIF